MNEEPQRQGTSGLKVGLIMGSLLSIWLFIGGLFNRFGCEERNSPCVPDYMSVLKPIGVALALSALTGLLVNWHARYRTRK